MLNSKDVEYIANLARIRLNSQELDKLTADLGNIIGYVEKLKELDVSQINPTSHPLSLENVYREDKIITSLTQDEALTIAPQKANGAFQVPQIIE